MKLLIVGPPGSGKGTRSPRLSRLLAVPHISTGELLRGAIRGGTPLGYSVSECVAGGRLVPDVLVNELVRERLGRSDVRDRGFLLDGFPRNLDQLDALLLWLVPDSLDAAIELAVSDEVAVQRLAIRGRTDDTAPAIRERLEAFERETKPLLGRLDAEGLLISVDADRPVNDVTEEVLDLVRKPRRHAHPISSDMNVK